MYILKIGALIADRWIDPMLFSTGFPYPLCISVLVLCLESLVLYDLPFLLVCLFVDNSREHRSDYCAKGLGHAIRSIFASRRGMFNVLLYLYDRINCRDTFLVPGSVISG